MAIIDTIYKDFGFTTAEEMQEFMTDHGFFIVQCPVCGNYTLDNNYICPNCYWEYDGTTDEDEEPLCSNLTIREYRNEVLNDFGSYHMMRLLEGKDRIVINI